MNLKTLLGKTFRPFANQKVPQGEFWSDEPPLESNLHLTQIILLIKCLEWLGTCALIMYLLGERSSPLHCGQNPLL
ncbi:MAG: hypothetical protein GPJ10_19470 [Microcystis aeruginosa L211-07]|nr:hypothetical protein [Microcystis aeruginosa L211-07]